MTTAYPSTFREADRASLRAGDRALGAADRTARTTSRATIEAGAGRHRTAWVAVLAAERAAEHAAERATSARFLASGQDAYATARAEDAVVAARRVAADLVRDRARVLAAAEREARAEDAEREARAASLTEDATRGAEALASVDVVATTDPLGLAAWLVRERVTVRPWDEDAYARVLATDPEAFDAAEAAATSGARPPRDLAEALAYLVALGRVDALGGDGRDPSVREVASASADLGGARGEAAVLAEAVAADLAVLVASSSLGTDRAAEAAGRVLGAVADLGAPVATDLAEDAARRLGLVW